MNVQHILQLGNGHSIELGEATWDNNARSVRSRYKTSTGGFSPRSSPETPIYDLVPMLQLVAKHDELSPVECAEIISVLAESIKRQCT